jgi:hypothetical protein
MLLFSMRKRQAEATASNDASSSSKAVTKVAKLNEEEGGVCESRLEV